MKKAVIAVVACTLTLGLASTRAEAQQNFTFLANITSGQEVPPNDVNAFGVAFVTFNFETTLLCFSISYADIFLSSPETAAHFHASAPPGQNAPVRVSLPPGSPKNGCVVPEPPLMEEEVNNLFAGLWYINIHTAERPGGEIRGQVISQSNPAFDSPAKASSRR